MATKITRKTAFLFGISAGATGIEEFASKEVSGTLVYSIDPAGIQTAAWPLGLVASIYEGVGAPYYQDRNAIDLVTFYQIAYFLQQGVPEWDGGTTYFTDSVVQLGGSIYISLQDNNTTEPSGSSNSYWTLCAFPSTNQAKSPTHTVLTVGSGTYTPPAGCTRIFIRMVGGGGGGGGGGNPGSGNAGSSGTNTTFGTLTAFAGGGGEGWQSILVAGGSGGAASGGQVNISGGTGNGYHYGNWIGVRGGSKFGGAGNATSFSNSNGSAAEPNSGSGGGAGNLGESGYQYGGGGGGSGGYVEDVIYYPSSMSYYIGVGGGGGSGASGGGNGGAGGSGIIIIDEFYY